ncbi:MAG: DNA repair protein RecO [Elusimicrobia bacterium]|nr:DNA repair protein RecO [Elusimicrobiota bacterium]
MSSFNAEGILIRSYDYGDGHRIISAFTREAGKIKAVARGSRKVKSKLAAYLEPASHNIFSFHSKKGQGLYTLTGVRPLDTHEDLRKDMKLFGYASIILESVDVMTAENDPDLILYSLLTDALKDLSAKEPSGTFCLFLFRLLKAAGYRLEMFSCISCGREISGKAGLFSFSLGGIVCSDCRQDSPCLNVSKKTLGYIRKLSEKLALPDDVEEEIGNIIQKYIKYEFGKDLNSREFMKIFGEKCTFKT